MAMERGIIGRLPFLATGAGSPMLFAGGLSLEAGLDSVGAEWMAAAMLAPFAKHRRVLFVNRRKGLPRGMTMAEIAAEHADAIRELGAGPVAVAGISTGGSIAQQLAADHPDVVERLVLLSTACRLGPGGKVLQRRIAARVRAGAHRRALAVAMAGLVPPRHGQIPVAVAAALAGPRVLAPGDDLSDLATTIEAEDAFDLATCSGAIRAPTLILAGADDRFYSRALFEETAALIPGSRLRVFEGRGHITAAWDAGWSAEIEGFLGQALGSSPEGWGVL
jgi:pimeloyl-ACP methyl ester carboxylesterase